MEFQHVTKTNQPNNKREIHPATKPVLPTSTLIHPILHLQRALGNQAVQRLFKSGVLQAKLKIGQPNDIYEQEADSVAEQVMRMPDKQRIADSSLRSIADGPTPPSIGYKPYAIGYQSHQPSVVRKDDESVQTKPTSASGCSSCKEEELIQQKPLKLGINPLIQRQVEEEEEILQTKETSGRIPEVTPILESRINALKGSGSPLLQSVRAFFKPRFGYDFSWVRVHTDSNAAQLNRDLNAEAFTHGRDIYFGAGRYNPGTSSGRRLLAHELTHVVQQGAIESMVHRAGNYGMEISMHLSQTDLRIQRITDPRVCDVLGREQGIGTWGTISEYNAITGNPPGRNLMIKVNDGDNADLNWALDVGWVTGEIGGDCSTILGTVFGRLGEVFCAGLGGVAGGSSYWFARIVGAAVTAYSDGLRAGWRYLTSGSINQENLMGAMLGMRIGASGAVGGTEKQFRDFTHPEVLRECNIPIPPVRYLVL